MSHPIPRAIQVLVYERANRSCEGCVRELPGHLEFHHIKPRDLGGTDTPGNLMLLCRKCHKAIEKTNRIKGFLEDADILTQMNTIADREGVEQSVIVKRAIRFFLESQAK